MVSPVFALFILSSPLSSEEAEKTDAGRDAVYSDDLEPWTEDWLGDGGYARRRMVSRDSSLL